jgi:excisionase family DNA binding protein
MNQKLFTVNEVADFLKLDPNVIKRLLREKKLKGFKVTGGNHWRVSETDLQDYINTRRQTNK